MPVPGLVMVEYGFDIEWVHVAANEDAGANHRMAFDGAAFLVGKRFGFEEDVVADPGFAEVVDEGGECEVTGVTPIPAEATCQSLRIGGDSAGVLVCDDVTFLYAVGECEQDLPVLSLLIYTHCFHLLCGMLSV